VVEGSRVVGYGLDHHHGGTLRHDPGQGAATAGHVYFEMGVAEAALDELARWLDHLGEPHGWPRRCARVYCDIAADLFLAPKTVEFSFAPDLPQAERPLQDAARRGADRLRQTS
jgi:hypothetical protein